jgi:hypothetical protein
MSRYQLELYFRGSELFLLGFLLVAYFALLFTGRLRTVCFFAVVSASCAVFNPYIVSKMFSLFGVGVYGRAFSYEFVFTLLAAVITGHIALYRIKHSPTPLRGRQLAWLGLIIGYGLTIGIVVVIVAIGIAVSGIKG